MVSQVLRMEVLSDSARYRLERTSRRLATCFGLFAVVSLLNPVVAALSVGRTGITIDASWVKNLPAEIPVLLRALLLVVGVLIAIPWALTFKRVRDLFRLYAQGQIFTFENIACLRSIARALVWSCVSVIFGDVLMNLCAGLFDRRATISLGIHGTEIVLFAVAAVVYAIAYVMDLARAIDEERSQFV
jgi:hypothetical protein